MSLISKSQTLDYLFVTETIGYGRRMEHLIIFLIDGLIENQKFVFVKMYSEKGYLKSYSIVCFILFCRIIILKLLGKKR